MRIFYAADTTPNAAFQSNLWRDNLLLPLIDLGHDVVEFQYDLRETFQNLDPADSSRRAFIKTNRPRVSNELLRQVKEAHSLRPLDLFFSYFYDACVLPETIDKIRAMGIKAVNWYCNGSYQLHLVREISPHYDWCLVPEKFRLDDYRRLGARPIYCQMAANPSIYKPYDLPYEFDVSFVGQAYGDRPWFIRHLFERGIDVHVCGAGWPKVNDQIRRHRFSRGLRRALWYAAASIVPLPEPVNSSWYKRPLRLPESLLGGVLADEDMVRMYSRSKINLGFSTCGSTHRDKERILQVRLRDFEVPMSGGFYMVEYMEELEEFFAIGQEIVCYRDLSDLSTKIKYYLAHDDERETIRQAGYERCQSDHTWHKRFQTAFREMGLER